MSTHPTKKALEVLYELLAEVQNKVDNSVISRIEQSIQYLEVASQRNSKKNFTSSEVLKILGTVIAELPEILAAIQKMLK